MISIDKESSHYRDWYKNGLDGYTDKEKAIKFAKNEDLADEIHVAEYWSGSLAGIIEREKK